MKLLAPLALCLLFCFYSCSKNSDNTPPPTPPDPIPQDTVYSALVERLVYRFTEDGILKEEIYSLHYDDNDRLIETRREDLDKPLVRLQYAGDKISSVTEYTSQGLVAETYNANQWLVVTNDTVKFSFLRNITPTPDMDTISSEYIFQDNLMRTGTHSIGATDPAYSSSYKGFIFEYGPGDNVVELGWINVDQQYFIHMNVTAVDEKKNPLYEASPVSYVFCFARIDAELTMSKNNITGIKYANGDLAELVYTYNKQGYPVTVKNKAQDFIKYEFKYKIQK